MQLPTIGTTTARASVCGGADLCYTMQKEIGTRLLRQTVRPPLHLAKAYHENDWAISILTSPTAGLLQGDAISVNATVAENARAALISPAACRVHTMKNGSASVVQKFLVKAGAALDVWPAPLILQKNAVLEQHTEIDCAADASLFFTEIVTPGRAAHGESFEFKKWRSSLRLRRAGQLLAYENFTCEPKKGQPADWRKQFPNGLYASIYCLSPEPLNGLIDLLHALETTDAALGVSPLRAGGLAIKILAQDGIGLRETILKVRTELMAVSGIKFPHALQRAQTFFY